MGTLVLIGIGLYLLLRGGQAGAAGGGMATGDGYSPGLTAAALAGEDDSNPYTCPPGFQWVAGAGCVPVSSPPVSGALATMGAQTVTSGYSLQPIGTPVQLLPASIVGRTWYRER